MTKVEGKNSSEELGLHGIEKCTDEDGPKRHFDHIENLHFCSQFRSAENSILF